MSLRRAAAAAVLVVCATAAQSQVVLVDEGFNNITTLAGNGWVLNNASTPVGSTGWFQGLPAASGFFDAQSGPANSYIAGNYNNAIEGGTIANWLITPTFSTENAGTVSLWARADLIDDFADHLRFGFSNGSTNLADFMLAAPVTIGGDWTQYTFSFAAQGAGSTARFAVVYTGDADASNYVGVDTLTVTAVPEPETWAMLMLGMVGMGVVARRRKTRS